MSSISIQFKPTLKPLKFSLGCRWFGRLFDPVGFSVFCKSHYDSGAVGAGSSECMSSKMDAINTAPRAPGPVWWGGGACERLEKRACRTAYFVPNAFHFGVLCERIVQTTHQKKCEKTCAITKCMQCTHYVVARGHVNTVRSVAHARSGGLTVPKCGGC